MQIKENQSVPVIAVLETEAVDTTEDVVVAAAVGLS